VDQVWADDSFSPLDEFRYGYDLAGNRTQRQNVLADAADKDFSEVYAYDEIYRLIGTDRGRFASGSFVKAGDFQDWSLDGLGNWSGFNDNGAEQERTVNAANEITAIGGSGAAQPTYDAAGNLTGDGTLRYVHDAWNRQVAVRRAADDAPVAEYAYAH
jgi:hypothetical protein